VRDTGADDPERPVLLLLHGLGATGGLNWAGAFPTLARRYRVVAMDHRGHGRGIRARKFRLADCADDVAALVETLGLANPILVGYSMGGPVAALSWQRHPDLFDGIVFCATARNFGGKPVERIGLAALALAGWPPFAVPDVAMRAVSSLLAALPVPGVAPMHARWGFEEMCLTDVRSVMQAAGELGRFDCRPWISDIDIPTAVVTTTHDRMVPVARQARLALSIPSAVIHPVSSGHLDVGFPHASKLSEEILRACDGVARRAAAHPRLLAASG
jgi:3-oxoadipate enol-lactonase